VKETLALVFDPCAQLISALVNALLFIPKNSKQKNIRDRELILRRIALYGLRQAIFLSGSIFNGIERCFSNSRSEPERRNYGRWRP
jgi:hypothetical protein